MKGEFDLLETQLKVGIIGSGNIGTDLMYKLERSPFLQLTAMIGIDPQSDGLKRARERGYQVYDTGLNGYLQVQEQKVDLMFDATSAKAHLNHALLLRDAGIPVIDLTPAALGPFVSPVVNPTQYVGLDNVNMITCGGQATIPIVYAVSRVAEVKYAEIVATVSSRSAGPGTRANIDEFTITTRRGLEVVGGAKKGKAIIILNPAEPPIIMRDTIYVEVEEMRAEEIVQSIRDMVRDVQSYVPGYRLKADPMIDGHHITVFVEVEGAGDYFPPYAGNLDIMTAAAVRVGEEYAKHRASVQTTR